jgi:organic hydroperoxide reductase OsmC/OhrA
MKQHNYSVKIEWEGNTGQGTLDYKSYDRNHRISAEGKHAYIKGSADPSFLGDSSRYNPEELLLSSIASCHMLWYLHLCAVNKVVVTSYTDYPTGTMEETKDGSGKFTEVTLHPKVTVRDSRMIHKANELHEMTNAMCFVANSCNFPIKHKAETISE